MEVLLFFSFPNDPISINLLYIYPRQAFLSKFITLFWRALTIQVEYLLCTPTLPENIPFSQNDISYFVKSWPTNKFRCHHRFSWTCTRIVLGFWKYGPSVPCSRSGQSLFSRHQHSLNYVLLGCCPSYLSRSSMSGSLSSLDGHDIYTVETRVLPMGSFTLYVALVLTSALLASESLLCWNYLASFAGEAQCPRISWIVIPSDILPVYHQSFNVECRHNPWWCDDCSCLFFQASVPWTESTGKTILSMCKFWSLSRMEYFFKNLIVNSTAFPPKQLQDRYIRGKRNMTCAPLAWSTCYEANLGNPF